MAPPVPPLPSLAVIGVLLWVLLVLGGCSEANRAEAEAEVSGDAKAVEGLDLEAGLIEVWIDGRRFELELALTESARTRGLAGREEIADKGGMLFVFPRPAELVFWMRGCLAPIDLIYLDAEGRVLNMHQMSVEPPGTPLHELARYPSDGRAQLAVELAGGKLSQLDIGRGDRIELPLGALKNAAR